MEVDTFANSTYKTLVREQVAVTHKSSFLKILIDDMEDIDLFGNTCSHRRRTRFPTIVIVGDIARYQLFLLNHRELEIVFNFWRIKMKFPKFSWRWGLVDNSAY